MSTAAFLTSWAIDFSSRGGTIALEGPGKARHYLARMDFHAHCGVPFQESNARKDERGRFIPLHLVDDSSSVKNACDSICNLVLSQVENAGAFLPAMEWTVNEVLDNIHIHADSPIPGVVVAQYYPERTTLEIAVCDYGRGIKATLSEAMELDSHQAALSRALERGVTRNQEVGQGNGLAGSLAITQANGGELCLWTGDCVYRDRAGQASFAPLADSIPGTGVFLSLKADCPVDLGETFIGERDWSYLDVLARDTSAAGGLRVTDECINFGTRATAQALRRRILGLLLVMEEPLVIDFTGVERASSSFLDELLGRLMHELGEGVFRSRLSIVNLTPQLTDMANVVIHQRLATPTTTYDARL